jgi:hypothetical protein
MVNIYLSISIKKKDPLFERSFILIDPVKNWDSDSLTFASQKE